MLVNNDLQKDNVSMIMFFEPEMTINQCQWNEKDQIHTIEMQHVTGEMRDLDKI